MNAKERAKMARLEAENARLREQLERSMTVYRENVWELVDLRTQLDLVRAALSKESE